MTDASTHSAVRVFLAAAVSPRLQAATRWVAVDALSKRTFALSGKDSGSPLLHWLANGRPDDADGELPAAADRLGVSQTLLGGHFLTWYRTLNRGYPFLDYSSDTALRTDAQLMAAYAAEGDVPGPGTPWPGTRHQLPPGQLAMDVDPQPPSARLLAAWLRLAAGFTRIRKLPHSTIAYRTSPSGGARHPTDIGVHMNAGWPISAGPWWYDPLEHALVPGNISAPTISPSTPQDVVFVLTSHVKRAMWRYRDVRALRPVLIDAGHVIESLLAVVNASGWSAGWYPAADLVSEAGGFDALLGYVIARPTETLDAAPDRTTALPAGLDSSPKPESPPRLRTNPLVSLIITGRQITAQNHLRAHGAIPATPTMIDALAYATPSSRGDRPTEPDAIRAATGVNNSEVQEMVANGMLLHERVGDKLWERTRHWSEHDWFLSLLAHTGESLKATTSEPPAKRRPLGLSTRHLPAALDQRRTCRAMTGEPLADAVMERVLATAKWAPEGLRVILTMRHDVRLASGKLTSCASYLLDAGEWVRGGGRVPSEDEVTQAAIGQPWTRGFAALFWLVPAPAPGPGNWEASLVDCGRFAQRLALAASAEPGIGVFQSPALVDDLLADILEQETSPDGAYLVGIGVAADTASETGRLFRPSDLIHRSVADSP